MNGPILLVTKEFYENDLELCRELQDVHEGEIIIVDEELLESVLKLMKKDKADGAR